MSKDFDAVEMVRKIRDDIYEQTKEMSAKELVEYFRQHGSPAEKRWRKAGRPHEAARQAGE
jgi:hypothetical protein